MRVTHVKCPGCDQFVVDADMDDVDWQYAAVCDDCDADMRERFQFVESGMPGTGLYEFRRMVEETKVRLAFAGLRKLKKTGGGMLDIDDSGGEEVHAYRWSNEDEEAKCV